MKASSTSHIYFPPTTVYFPEKVEDEQGSSTRYTSLQRFLLTKCPSLWHPYCGPWWLFRSGHLQTLQAAIGDFSKIERVMYHRTHLRLLDGGTIGLDFAQSVQLDSDSDRTPVLVVLHGLSGGSQESYVQSVLVGACRAKSEGGLGYRAVVVNFRGCGGTPITSPKFYTAGHTDDLRQALLHISNLWPSAPLLGLGFSMGANILTRYLSEEGSNSRIRAACALACPWNLARNNELLNKSFFSKRIYAKSLGTSVQTLLRTHAASFAKFPKSTTTDALAAVFQLKNPTLEDFDNVYTRLIGGESPLFPFPTTEKYYLWASSHHTLSKIRIPYLAINAAGDPIVQEIPTDCGDNGYVAMVVTDQGGHLGWFEQENSLGGVDRWIRKPVLEYLRAVGEELELEPSGAKLYTEDGFLREEGRKNLGCRVLSLCEVLDLPQVV